MFSDSSEYIIYADESGDHSLSSIDSQHPIFALAFCIFKKSDYTNIVLPRINQFKFNFWGHDLIILHNREIRRPEKEFGFLKFSENLRDKFFTGLNQLIEELPFAIISTVIDKRLLKEKYDKPHSPYETALKFCLERSYSFLEENGSSQHITNVIVEQRGLKEDKELQLAFSRIVDNENWHKKRLPFEIMFANKKINSCGLQIADLVVHPIGRYVINGEQNNRSFKILENKIVCRNGIKEGYGLKIFPRKAQNPGKTEVSSRPDISNPYFTYTKST